ncbi:MAG TPA: TadE/TadG family type IV pilus assembly protein [Acidimicrobiales bacterium]
MRDIAKRLRRRDDDERGAEMVEFAIVVVLLITILYGIITFGLILAANATITQAAADAARTGIAQGTGTSTCTGPSGTPDGSASTAACSAVAQAATDVAWMNKGCVETIGPPLSSTNTTAPTNLGGSGPITCNAYTESCPSSGVTYNGVTNSSNMCLSVTVSYNYSSQPLFPELPGLGIITPSTLSSTNVLQISTPTNS